MLQDFPALTAHKGLSDVGNYRTGDQIRDLNELNDELKRRRVTAGKYQ